MSSAAVLDLQTVSLERAAPCVRLLNLNGTVGCATPSAGVTVPLTPLLAAGDLDSLPTAAAEPHAFLLAAELFTSEVVHRLQSTLGPNLAGLLVLHAESPPEGAAASDAGLSLERFQFAIVLLDAADSERVLTAIGAVPTNATTQSVVGAAARPLVQLQYPMHGRNSSRHCLAEGTCLPLGGQSVWGALAPRLTPGAPVVLLAAQTDGTAFFHEAAPAAHQPVAKGGLPCLRTPPPPRAWWLRGARPLPRATGPRLGRVEACRALRSASQLAPKALLLPLPPGARGGRGHRGAAGRGRGGRGGAVAERAAGRAAGHARLCALHRGGAAAGWPLVPGQLSDGAAPSARLVPPGAQAAPPPPGAPPAPLGRVRGGGLRPRQT
jgi:hypothetical protein